MNRAARAALALGLLAGVVTAAMLLPLGPFTLGLLEWVRGAGLGGALLYGGVYVVATVLMLPGSLLGLGAGFAYGPVFGTLLVSPASVLGATLAFWIGRSIARGWVGRRAARNPRFLAVDDAIGRNGFKIVLLLRLSPVFPFNFLNYALGLTRVDLGTYVLASFLGMLPGTVLYVYLGSLITSAAEIASGAHPAGGWAEQVLYWGGLVATVVVAIVVTRIARRALGQAIEGAAGWRPGDETTG